MERARTIQAQLGGNAKANVAAGRGAHAESVARELELLQVEQARLRARATGRTAELAETERKAECLAQQNAKLTAESDLLLTELRRTHTAAERGLQEAQRWQHSAQVCLYLFLARHLLTGCGPSFLALSLSVFSVLLLGHCMPRLL